MTMHLSVDQRAQAYREAFAKWPASHPQVHEGRIYGMWLLGQNYRSKSGYYGSYPPNYLERVMAFFPDAERVLHLFSGSLPPGPYVRFDCRPELDPDVVGDAHELTSHFEPGSFDLVVADPLYSGEDAEHYGTPMVSRRKVMAAVHPVLAPGGWVAWLDQAWPQFSKKQFTFRGAIGAVRSTNHRVRAVFFSEAV